MKKNFEFEKDKDISTKHISFLENKNYSLRNVIRDLYDTFLRRPFYFLKYKNFFKYQNYNINLVLPAKGFSTLSRRKKLNSMKKIEGKKILNIGCGNAYDYHLWFKFKPKKIVGIDVMNYKKSWDTVLNYKKNKNIKTDLEFYKDDFVNFNYEEKFDFIVSDAVFEHCRDFDSVIKKCSEYLNKDGIMYASYGGPMWLTYGGDHFSGRDNINSGYNHLLMEKIEYRDYVKRNIGSFDYELNEGGGGGILVENDLFSKLSANEYFNTFKKYNFYSENTYVEYCPIGFNLLKNNLSLKIQLEKKFPNIELENFYLKTHIVYLKKNIL